MADIPGRYVHKKSASHFIELKPDNTYVLFDGAATFSGTYKVNGSVIAISSGESVSQGTIQNGVITDDEGEKWVHVSVKAKSAEDPLVAMLWLPPVLRRTDFPWEIIDALFVIAIFLLVARR